MLLAEWYTQITFTYLFIWFLCRPPPKSYCNSSLDTEAQICTSQAWNSYSAVTRGRKHYTTFRAFLVIFQQYACMVPLAWASPVSAASSSCPPVSSRPPSWLTGTTSSWFTAFYLIALTGVAAKVYSIWYISPLSLFQEATAWLQISEFFFF